MRSVCRFRPTKRSHEVAFHALFAVCLPLTALLILLCSMPDAQAGDVQPFAFLRRESYRVTSGLHRVETSIPAWDSRDSLALAPGTRLRRIRSFEAGGAGYALCVDVETLRAFVVREDDLWRGSVEENVDRGSGERVTSHESRVTKPEVVSGEEGIPEVCRVGEGSEGAGEGRDAIHRVQNYERALERYARAPMKGKGLKGVILTVDLCPSHRRWDRDLFEALREVKGDRPLPVAVCISGAWVRHHVPEFEQLCAWNRAGGLDLTFVNHSDTHPVGAHGDFLNSGEVDFEGEVLNAEVTLLAHGVVPSPFFRFPGLVHSAARLTALTKYGLIPVDADHWPGRDDTVTDRVPEGILLLHGNGNERAGVRWFFEMAEQTGLKEKWREGQYRALSLVDCARDEP